LPFPPTLLLSLRTMNTIDESQTSDADRDGTVPASETPALAGLTLADPPPPTEEEAPQDVAAAAAVPPSSEGGAPLMSPADRARVKRAIQDQFRINPNFFVHIAFIRARMRDKLHQARENIAARHEAAGRAPEPTEEELVKKRRDRRRKERSLLRKSSGVALLEQRLEHLRLSQVFMEDDGNCQFRSMAHQLRGDAGGHGAVRRAVVEHLRDREEQFSLYFDGREKWEEYVDHMAEDETWGDELTLKAASNIFGCNVHVLTSDRENYYMCYAPEGKDEGKEDEGEGRAAAPPEVDDIFLAYISPVHYNSIILMPEEEDQ